MVDQRAEREKFIEENLGLVHSLCRRFIGRGIEYDDLYQAGCVGLIKAADGFDRSRGLCFSTYAVPVVLGELRRLFRDGGAVKVSRSLKELSMKVSKVSSRLSGELGREPLVSEIAAEIGCSAEEVSEAICAAQPVVSLTCDGEGGVLEFDLPTPDPGDELCDKILISKAMDSLNETEKRIIQCRYFHGMTQSKTAQLLSMTQVQVSRSEKKTLQKLKLRLSS